MQKKVFFVAIIAMLSLFFISAYKVCFYSDNVAVGSDIFSRNGCVFYNSVGGDICKFEPNTKIKEKILDNKKMISACDYILCKNNDVVEIFDYNGNCLKQIANINILYGEVHGEILYYIENIQTQEKTTIRTIKLSTGEKTEFVDIQASRFKIDNNKIYYVDKDIIYSYDIKNRETKKVYEGKYCYFFSVKDTTIYLSDFTKNQNLVIVENGCVEMVTDIKTTNFCVDGDIVYYTTYISEDVINIWKNKRNIGQVIEQYSM